MGHELELVAMDENVLASFNNYTGAIAANRDAGTIAVSSPQGNALAVLDAASGKVVSFQTLAEVCGLAPDGDGFMATTGRGQIIGGRRRRCGVRRLFLGQPHAQDRLRLTRRAQTVPATSETAIALRSTATKRSPASSRGPLLSMATPGNRAAELGAARQPRQHFAARLAAARGEALRQGCRPKR